MADTLDRLSGGMNEQTAEMGHSLALLQAYFTNAFEGIERAAAKPVLEYLSKHIDEIEPKIEALAGEIKDDLAGAWEILEGAVSALRPVLDPLSDELGQVLPTIADVIKVTGDLARLLTDEFQPAIDALGPAFGPLVAMMSPFLASLTVMQSALEEIDRLILKQRELSGLNEGTKAQILGMENDIKLILPRVALTKDDRDSLKKFKDEANDADDRLDYGSMLKDTQKIDDLLRTKLKETGELRDIISQVEALAPTVHLDPEQIRHFKEMANVTNLDSAKGDIHGALENETDLLEQLKSFAPAVNQAALSGAALSSTLDHLNSVIGGVIDRLDVHSGGRGSFGSDGVASAGGFGGSAPGQGGQSLHQNVTVNAQFDHTESVNQLAAKLHPQFRSIRSRHQQQFEGAAMLAMARSSMGGEG